MTNNVPLLVNLYKKRTVTAEFHTTIPAKLEVHVKLNHEYSSLLAQESDILAECSATYGDSGNLACVAMVQASDGKAQIDIDATASGTQAQLNTAIKTMCDNGFKTTN